VLVSAVGFLNVPQQPPWPGLDRFKGPVFRTARWEHEHDLTGKRVAIVGTGSSAAQIVPELAGAAGRLLLFQREPGWVMPKGERDFTSEERETLLDKREWRRARLRALYQIEKRLWHGGTYRPGSKVHDQSEQICRDYIAKVFADRPDLKEAVTPTYPFWGKRLIYASTYYPALKRDNVDLVPRAVTRVTEAGVIDTEGVPGYHGPRLSQLLHDVRAGDQRRRDHLDAGASGRVRRPGLGPDDSHRQHRHRSQATVDNGLQPVAAAGRPGHGVDGEQELLQGEQWQDRHPMALQPTRLPGPDEVARSLV
jgi:Flavin-binding monooxygenase-like